MITDKDAEFLLAARGGDSIIINGTAVCSFAQTGKTAFGRFERDSSSPSATAAADISLDDESGTRRGMIYITRHDDLKRYSCVIFDGGKMTDVLGIKART